MAQPPKSPSAALAAERTPADLAERSRALPALQGGARIFTLGDILNAAEWRGDLAEFRTGWLARRASAVAAAKMELAPSAAEVESAVDDFRYARDLVSAEECERWLAQRGLEFEHLTACMARRLQSALVDADEPEEFAAGEEALFAIEAILADDFALWARRLARRVALALDAGTTFPANGGLDELWPRLEEYLQAAIASWITPERQRRALANQRLGLTHLTLEVAEFDSEHAAREARLCTVEDGVALAGTAAANDCACKRTEDFLEDLPEGWRPVLVGARSGDIVAPPSEDDCFRLLHVLRRREPSLEDEAVVARLNDGLMRQRLQELETRHIRWTITVEADA